MSTPTAEVPRQEIAPLATSHSLPNNACESSGWQTTSETTQQETITTERLYFETGDETVSGVHRRGVEERKGRVEGEQPDESSRGSDLEELPYFGDIGWEPGYGTAYQAEGSGYDVTTDTAHSHIDMSPPSKRTARGGIHPPSPPHSDSIGTISLLDRTMITYQPEGENSFFSSGRLLLIDENANNEAIAGRLLLVLAVSDHGWPQCVCVCRHKGYDETIETAFYRAHTAVYGADKPQRHRKVKHEPIQLEMEQWASLETDCYVNLEHTWTLSKNIRVAKVGWVSDGQRKELVEMYQQVQKALLDRTIDKIKDGD